MQQKMNGAMASKPHYEVLDGIRGVAAIWVLGYHIAEKVFPDFTTNPMGHGPFVVDLFFCMSGFVIGYAYDDRIGKIGAGAFLRNRFIRLHPMVILGSVLGLLGYIFDPYVNGIALAGWGKTMLAFFCSILMVPSPILEARYGSLFPLNVAAWTLFMEYLITLGYAFFLAKIRRVWMIPMLFVAAIWLGYYCYSSGFLIGGWDDKTYLTGLARVSYSFLAGLCVYRFKLVIKNRLGFPLITFVMLCFFLIPHSTGDWVIESGVVIFIFPAIVALAAGATVQGRLRTVAIFLGRLSFPLYMTHIFATWILGEYIWDYKPAGWHLVLVVTGVFFSLLLLAWLSMRFYDEPLRAYLVRKWVRGGAVRKGIPAETVKAGVTVS
jgi:peptidoglycan/LPS O-acetylase OafA/YrhL